MKVQCYAIFDQCSGIYEKPFFSTTDDLVKREFFDVANTPDHQIARHPEHYSLWRLGIFDNTNGKIVNEDNECLCTALELISQGQNTPQLEASMANADANDPDLVNPGLTN